MKGKIKETVNRWWVLALVATLALSLTSCGMKRSSYLTSGGAECDGNESGKPSMGYFSVSTAPYGNDIAIYITVLEPAVPGDQVSVVLLGDGTVRELSGVHTLAAGSRFFAGTITQEEWQTFDTVSIEDALNGILWKDSNPEKITECALP